MKRRLIRWGVPLLVVALLIAVATIVLTHWMNGGSDGTVHMGTPVAQKQTVNTLPTEPVSVTSSYYTTTLPGGFTVRRQADVTSSGPTLAQFSANTRSETDQQIGITIGRLPSDGLAGVADYHLRTSDTATYAAFTPAGLPAGALAFRTTQGPAAITIFWPHDALYAELSFSTEGQAASNALLTTYSQVLANWAWK